MESVLMMKQMDLDEWELLPNPYDDHDGSNKIKIHSSKYDDDDDDEDDSVLEMNYFICPPKPCLLQPNITLNPHHHHHDEGKKEEINTIIPPVAVGDQEAAILSKMDYSPKSPTPIGGFQGEFDSSSSGIGIGNSSNNVWKRGMGAICSFGITAAATFCIIVLSHHNNRHPNQKLRFQIYSTHKVIQQASKLNDAIRGGGGVPINRARITCGGYYDATATP